MSAVLRGLKPHLRPKSSERLHSQDVKKSLISDLTAIVAVTDDGGSSGVLRRDFGIPPPGDLRNCIAALADEEHLLADVFAHRFRGGAGLDGHSVGNLLIAALTEMTSDFAQAVKLACSLLALQGRILPATPEHVTLAARVEDGSILRGETNITAGSQPIVELMLEPPRPKAHSEALGAIARADLVVVGPGSLYTSLITNLLVDGMADAIAATRAVRVYVANLMTQPNESLHLTVSQHIDRIYQHAGMPIFDFALVNTGAIPEHVRKRYAAQGAEPAFADIGQVEAMGIRCVIGDFVQPGELPHHAPGRIANAVLPLAHKSMPAQQEQTQVGEGAALAVIV